jgi:hypothetical protein
VILVIFLLGWGAMLLVTRETAQRVDTPSTAKPSAAVQNEASPDAAAQNEATPNEATPNEATMTGGLMNLMNQVGTAAVIPAPPPPPAPSSSTEEVNKTAS